MCMIEDDVTVILKKTRDYFEFIKKSLAEGSVLVKNEDKDTLKNIETYLHIIGEDMSTWGTVKSDVHKNILGTCMIYLEHLDRIAKDYEVFQNGHTHA